MNENKPFLDIIKESFGIFSANKLKFLWLSLLCYFPVQLVMNLVNWKMSSNEQLNNAIEKIQQLTAEAGSEAQINEALQETSELSSKLLPYYLILALLAILSFVFTIAIAKIARDESSFLDYKENSTALDYMSFAIKKLPVFLLTYFCFILMATLGFILFFVPGIIVLMGMLVIVPLLVYSEKTGFKSVWASLRLLFKRPSISFCFLCCSLISMGFSYAVLSLLDLFSMPGIANVIISAVLSTAVNYFLLTIEMIPYLLYLNRVSD